MQASHSQQHGQATQTKPTTGLTSKTGVTTSPVLHPDGAQNQHFQAIAESPICPYEQGLEQRWPPHMQAHCWSTAARSEQSPGNDIAKRL